MNIHLRDFTKKYGDYTAVNHLEYTFEENKITGILGPNGAGKTTILKALTARHFPTYGQVIFEDNETSFDSQENAENVRLITGFVEETASLPGEYTIKEYLNYMTSLTNSPKDNLEKTISTCGLEEVLSKKIRELSKGYKERVSFAKALVSNPQILVLDEPASGLDPAQIVNMRKIVKKLSENHTIILSTHLMQEVEALCSNVLIINKGTKVVSGNIKEIADKTGSAGLEEAYFKLVNNDDE